MILPGFNQVFTRFSPGFLQVFARFLTGFYQDFNLTRHLRVPIHVCCRFVCRYQRLDMHTSVGLSSNMQLTMDSCFNACIFVCTYKTHM